MTNTTRSNDIALDVRERQRQVSGAVADAAGDGGTTLDEINKALVAQGLPKVVSDSDWADLHRDDDGDETL